MKRDTGIIWTTVLYTNCVQSSSKLFLHMGLKVLAEVHKGGLCHTVRGTNPGEEAAGGTVMAVR